MKVTFLGVGEAFDENQVNTSILIESQNKKILMDCGFTAPFALWKNEPWARFPDFITISHFHADHTFGIPALLIRMAEENREKPLHFIGMPGLDRFIDSLVELAYPGLMKKIQFEINFLQDERQVNFENLQFRFAETDHSLKNFAISVNDGAFGISFSGDGRPREETKRLYKDQDLLIHESYMLDGSIVGHGSVQEIIDMALSLKIKKTALVHLNREIRKNKMKEIKTKFEEANRKNPDCKFYLPEPGFSIDL